MKPGILDRISSNRPTWLGGNEEVEGTDEESQGLLSMAQKSITNVASQAGEKMGGQFGMAMQVATIGQEAWTMFFIFLGIGCVLIAGSITFLPLLMFAPQKFATAFTLGSVCILFSLAALKGIGPLVSHLTSVQRLPFSLWYFGSLAGTLYASLWRKSTTLTIVFSVMQLGNLLWFLLSYIPGGSWAMGTLQDALCGGLRKLCCGCFSSNSSIPL